MDSALAALKIDTDDLSAALHLIADGARGRGDDDISRVLRLLARHAEGLSERIEQLLSSAGETGRVPSCTSRRSVGQ